MALNYFYDNQIRRYIQQIQRVFSNFQVHLGKDNHGLDRYYRVPCVYGDADRMAQHIKRSNSENTLLPVPFFAVYDSDISPSPDRRQTPNHVDKRQFIERNFDRENNQYSSGDGYRYTVERLMPVPYNMTVTLDFWYTQTDHKLQLSEQIMTLFNEDIDLQTSDNPLDWSSRTVLKLANINWNSRGVPVGVDDSLRITSFSFEVPIWINPPAKVKQQRIIEQIVMDIYDTNIIGDTNIRNSWEGILNISPDNLDAIFDPSLSTRTIITPGFHYIEVSGNEVTLLGPDQGELNPETGLVWSWADLLLEYGKLQDNISLMRLRPVEDIEEVDFDFIGRLSTHTSANKLLWSVDLETIPADDIPSVTAIINPTVNTPGVDLPAPSNGTRYLITVDLPSPTSTWGTVTASANDIIEFNGAVWTLAFDSSAQTASQYTTNDYNGKKMKWDNDAGEWIIIPDGVWAPGYWRLVL